MAFDFPTSPTIGQLYPPTVTGGAAQYKWDGSAWVAVGSPANYLAKSGDIMTGLLTLSGPPTASLHAVTKTYADAGDAAATAVANTKLPLAGGTLTGALFLNADPVAPMHASSKQYVDSLQLIRVVRTVVFTSNGTYTPNANMIYCKVEAVAGGGGGGCGQSAVGWSTGAGGGSSGGYARSHFTKAQIGVSRAVTIGPGGAGGNPANGFVGGSTSFGGLVVAIGGNGGGQSAGGAGGSAGGPSGGGTGDLVLPGRWGDSALGVPTSQFTMTGRGGDSMFGSGGGSFLSSVASNGVAGSLGGGGGGGLAVNGAGGAGGAGGSGILIVTEYCSA